MTRLPSICFLLWASTSCTHKICTLIGCPDGIAFTISTSDATWPDGSYAVHFEAGAQTTDCAFRVAAGNPELTANTPFLCATLVESEKTCTDQQIGNSVSHACKPIAGHFHLAGLI